MNSVAASGGYYIATAGQWIVAQPGTITGSIGVISAKAITNELFDKLRVNRVEFTRGENASYYSDATPFTEQQRGQMLGSIQHIYQQFIGRVAASRHMDKSAVDAIGGGRVWTGAQAKENGLVDELGDIWVALKKARELADLPEDTPLVMVTGKHKPLPAQLAEEAKPAASLAYLQSGVRVFNGAPMMLMPMEWK